MNTDQEPVTKADLLNFQARLLATLKEQFSFAEQRSQDNFTALEQRFQEQFTALDERIQAQFTAFEQRIQEQFTALDERFQEQFTALDERIQAQFTAAELHMGEHVETVETRLLTAFQQWAVPVNGRLRRLETVDTLANERLVMIEERLMSLEKRLGPPKQTA